MQTDEILKSPPKRTLAQALANPQPNLVAQAAEVEYIRAYDDLVGPPPPPAVTESDRVVGREIGSALTVLQGRIAALDAKVNRLEGFPERQEQQLEMIRLSILGLNITEMALGVNSENVEQVAWDPASLSDPQLLQLTRLKLQNETTKLFLNNSAAERTRLLALVNPQLVRLEQLLRRLGRWDWMRPPTCAVGSGHSIESKITSALSLIRML